MKRQEFILKTRDVLRKRRAGLVSQLGRDLRELMVERQMTGDSADRAIDAERDLITAELATAESRELGRIEDALERMEEGFYGQCEVCHKDIPLARLQALPFAVRCVQCQRSAESESRRSTMGDREVSEWGRSEWPSSTAAGSPSGKREMLVSSP
jgi:DnaK suppressor protein